MNSQIIEVPEFDTQAILTANLVTSYCNDYFDDLVLQAKSRRINLVESQLNEEAYYEALSRNDFVMAANIASQLEEMDFFLIEAIQNEQLALVAELIALGADVCYEYFDDNGCRNYPISLAALLVNKQIFNLLLLHPDVDVGCVGEVVLSNDEVRHFLGYGGRKRFSPAECLLEDEYLPFLQEIRFNLNCELEDFKTLGTFLLESHDSAKIQNFIRLGGRLVDEDGIPAIEHAFNLYINRPTIENKQRLLKFKPYIAITLNRENCEDTFWLDELCEKADNPVYADLINALGIKEFVFYQNSLISEINDEKGELEDELYKYEYHPDRSVKLATYKAFEIDITQDLIALDAWRFPPFVYQVMAKQSPEGFVTLTLHDVDGVPEVFEASNLPTSGCFSMIDFASMLKAQLSELSKGVLALASERSAAFKSFLPEGFDYASALSECIDAGRLRIIGDDLCQVEQLKFELCKGLASKEVDVEDKLSMCANPDITIYVDSTALIIESTRQLWPEQDSKVLMKLDFYSVDAFRQAVQLTIHHIRTAIAEFTAFGIEGAEA